MGINGINLNQGVVWNNENSPVRGEKAVFNTEKPANFDKFVLNLPMTETFYKRQEFVINEKTAENCGICYTYMERTLMFANGKTMTFKSDDNDSYFAINTDKSGATFGKSGVKMNDLGHAVEETWERTDRTLEQNTISSSLSGIVSDKNGTVGGAVDVEVKSTKLTTDTSGITKGSLDYKDGAEGKYIANMRMHRDTYNKCAALIAHAFGRKSSELELSDDAFEQLFGNNSENQLKKLRDYMAERLEEFKRCTPGSKSLKAFGEAYLELGKREYSDIITLVEKMFMVTSKSS